MWIELTVTAGDGATVYQSGYLMDRSHPETGEPTPDGNLDDEDLDNLAGSIDPITLEADVTPGPDVNQRPEVNLGLMNFGNEFKRISEAGEEEVFVPFLANHMDNSHSVPPLETVRTQYDVPLPDGVQGPVQVSVRLRFRPFPPRFLRLLALARPDLVNETIVDHNRVVDMAEAERAVAVVVP